MQLRHARLCLNCEEVHSSLQCPICASEAYEYVTRWVPADERRTQPRPPAPPPTPEPASRMRWVRRGAAGVAVIAVSRLLWQLSRPVEWSAPELPPDMEAPPDPDSTPGSDPS